MKQDYKLTIEVNSSHLSDAAKAAMITSIQGLLNAELQEKLVQYDADIIAVFGTKEIDISLTAVKL